MPANWDNSMPHSHSKLLEIVKILNTNKNLFIEIKSNGDRLIDKDWNYTI